MIGGVKGAVDRWTQLGEKGDEAGVACSTRLESEARKRVIYEPPSFRGGQIPPFCGVILRKNGVNPFPLSL